MLDFCSQIDIDTGRPTYACQVISDNMSRVSMILVKSPIGISNKILSI